MNAAWTVARKELRALFQSSTALLFLGVFLSVTLFTFFSTSRFFARNLADVRPLFEWLPLLLIFLVSAVTMRMWAEERRAGTLEVLMTLPVRTVDLVLGKFTAGLALVALALLFTLPLPLTVSALGPLDWGPVVGGYVGALLLAGAYLAIGLCVSARTDNQVVALMTTLVVGGLVYLVGSDTITALFATDTGELLRAIGTGSRFESVERGVLDLRDLVYYGTVTATFLTLNYAFLEHDRLDVGSDRGRLRSRGIALLVGLVGLNAVAANVWLAPVTALRWDLTANKDYSVGPVTKAALASLDEPVFLEGYFSERTHPLLAPLIPRIRDLLAEYEVHGDGRVRVRIVDPSTDEALEQELGERYGMRSFPFGVTDRHSQAVVNSWFHILVRQGDQHEVLSFQDLIEVRAEDDGLDVRLRSLEYDLTRTIRKVTSEFQSTEAILAKLPEGAVLTAYVTPSTLPPDFQSTADAMKAVGQRFEELARGRLTFREVDPSGDRALQETLYADFGVQPLAVDLFGEQVFYLHLVLEAGDQVQRIMPRGDLTEGDLDNALQAAVRRATPGQLQTVAIFTEQPVARPNPQLPPHMQPPPPQPDYRGLQQLLSGDFDVMAVDLEDGHVPDAVDVLIVGKTGMMSDTQRFAIDQYLMRGGSVVALAGAYRIDATRAGLSAVREDESLRDLLAHYGVTVDDALVMDPRNAAFPIPVTERRGGFAIQRVELLPYPMFPDIRASGFDREHVALSGLPGVTMPWASPVSVADPLPEGVTARPLLTTSPGTWLNRSGAIDPDFARWPDAGFGPTGDVGPQTVAVSATGRFQSWYADKPNPLFNDEEHDGTGRTLTTSVADGRLVVLGSSELVSDVLVSLANQPQGEVHRGNLQLLTNLVDWSVEDTDLLQIRSSGAFARTLEPLTDEERQFVELVDYALVLLPLALLIALPRTRRSRPLATAPQPVET